MARGQVIANSLTMIVVVVVLVVVVLVVVVVVVVAAAAWINPTGRLHLGVWDGQAVSQ